MECLTSVYQARTVVWCALFAEQSNTSDKFPCERWAAPPVNGEGSTIIIVAKRVPTFSVLMAHELL